MANTYEPGRVGLLLVDLVNENFSKDGKAYSIYAPEYERLDTVNSLKKLITGVRRQEDVPVFYSRTSFTEEDYTAWRHVSGIHRQMFDSRMFTAGTWNTEFHEELAPQPGDVVLAPHKGLDVLQHTDLEFQLRQRGVEYLAIAGVSGIMAVESTARTAMERGYHVTAFTDAIAAPGGLVTYQAMMRGLNMVSHSVVGVDDFLASLGKSAA
ncbi:isochorismatase family cysteine hydrolase [Streptomyces spectabilis]|uniref:Cysteine hydrolase n=1 Tax=Streptomyces spectabilis TaxID=68270 RepID=A0A5P2X545_STRST|nr:isochorismatase family cysteine hydrolase [Streptomyces spectabilis]MBB5101552.1 nicotinamidase-related amidase [Streptomyces spectabilis]MCI3900737.1 cysteine hydrolase [Streptomyces spectabilis]QEV58275.1 cysteine hydrolase [Streptomyces spectabilis]GGV12100.1 peroxyureidoacrylate/ureidoacrylate amidohydrolase RutB [Streptomyces spectabilis]